MFILAIISPVKTRPALWFKLLQLVHGNNPPITSKGYVLEEFEEETRTGSIHIEETNIENVQGYVVEGGIGYFNTEALENEDWIVHTDPIFDLIKRNKLEGESTKLFGGTGRDDFNHYLASKRVLFNLKVERDEGKSSGNKKNISGVSEFRFTPEALKGFLTIWNNRDNWEDGEDDSLTVGSISGEDFSVRLIEEGNLNRSESVQLLHDYRNLLFWWLSEQDEEMNSAMDIRLF